MKFMSSHEGDINVVECHWQSEALQVLAKVMGTEACMARIGIASADHALACALFGQLRPGDHALFVSQALEEGTQALLSGPLGSLEDWGVKCTVVDPFTAGLIDENGALDAIRIAAWARKHKPNVVVLQRLLSPVLVHNGGVGTEAQDSSLTLCGGHFVTCSAIQSFGDAVRGACVSSVDEHSAHVMHGVREGDSTATAAHASEQSMRIPLVVVDNRGGEFVEELEPGDAGADLVTGSLLGSLGGSIAPSGGYVCGTQELIEKACARFCAPGVVRRLGSVSRSACSCICLGCPCTCHDMRVSGVCMKGRRGMQGCRSTLVQYLEIHSG